MPLDICRIMGLLMMTSTAKIRFSDCDTALTAQEIVLSVVRKMDLLGKVVFLVLFGYFVYRFTSSVERLYEGKIGTTVNRIRCLN